MNVNVDLVGKGQTKGDLANHAALDGLNVGMMRPYLAENKQGVLGAYATIFNGGNPANPKNYGVIQINGDATLRRDEWKHLDDAVLRVAEQRLVGIDDLRTHGLVYNLGNAFATTVLENHTMSDALEAELSMDAKTRSKNDRVTFGTTYTPIPIIHVDYQINARTLASSRKLGNALDTSQAERAARKVSQKLEDMLFTDTSYKFGGGAIYSYLNYPDKNDVTLTSEWDASAKTAIQILEDVMKMKQEMLSNYQYGPWMLYIPSNYETVLDEDYDSNTPGTTLRERILKIQGIDGVKTVDRLPDDKVVMVQMSTDTVRLVNGMTMQNVQWSSEGNMVNNYKVMTIQVPQLRSDDNGRTGIVVLSA